MIFNFGFKLNFKYATYIIGLLHMLLLIFRIYEIVWEVYILEDLMEIYQLIYITLITLLQILIIVALFVGASKESHFYLLPWLCFTAPIFTMSTAYAVLYLSVGDYVQDLINFVFVGFFWFSWYLVLRNYLYLKLLSNSYSYLHCKYSQLGEPSSRNGSLTKKSKIFLP